MKKRNLRKNRLLSALLALIMLTNSSVMTISAVVTSAGGSEKELSSLTDSSTKLDDVTIPTVDKNPYEVKIEQSNYPVYNDQSFEFFGGTDNNGVYDLILGYRSNITQPEGVSPFYTASLTPKFSYVAGNGAQIDVKLPYREGKTDMLNSEITMTNGGMRVDFSKSKEFIKQLKTEWNLNEEQTYLRVGATLLAGNGKIFVSGGYTETASIDNGEAKKFWVDVPIKDINVDDYVIFTAIAPDGVTYTTDSVLSEFFITLIDNSNPSVRKVTVNLEHKDDGTADIVLNMKLNEGVRVTSYNTSLEDVWLELELEDLNDGKTSAAKLYLQELSKDGELIFRGDIGLFHYKNFRINRIKKFNMPSKMQWPMRTMLDLVNTFCKSAYETVKYDNSFFEIDAVDYARFNIFNTTILSDYAGNPINISSAVNWRFGDQVNTPNTFEATEVRLFTEETMKKTEQVASGEKVDAEITDQFIGPSRNLIAYVYLNQMLTDEEASKVWIELNVLDKEGNPIKAYPTSFGEYKVDELYVNGTTRATLLKYENITFSEGMKLVADSEIPLVKIEKLGDDIEDKTAYHITEASVTDIYADFDAPLYTLNKYGAYSNTEGEGEGVDNYSVSIEIEIVDPKPYSENANLLGTAMFVELAGGVDKDTDFRYIFSDSSIPPKNADSYTGTGKLSKDGKVDIGSLTILNESTKAYIHLLFSTDDIYLDGLSVIVNAEDAVGNVAIASPTNKIEYKIDELPPQVKYSHRRAEVVDENTAIKTYIGMQVTDKSDIVRVLYSWGENPDALAAGTSSATWKTAEISRGKNVTVEIDKQFGDGVSDNDKIYNEILYVKAVDEYGNESEPIDISFAVSLLKPVTDMRYEGDMNSVSTEHKVIVKGPSASAFDGADAYTRVSVTPAGSEYSYVTIIKTGEEANILGFVGLTWYKVNLSGSTYIEVSEPESIGEAYTLSRDSILYDLFTHYGDIKVSFENGYGDMVPVEGENKSDAANAASYSADINYLTLRFASPFDIDRVVHGVDFGAIIDREDKVVVENADKGAAPYKYNANLKGVNPMRNSQIHFTVSNVAKHTFELLDFDSEGSYAELYRVGENGEADVLIAKQEKLAATGAQYFTIPSLTDDGEFFITGAYYLRVYIKSNSGHLDVYDSSRVVLDAQTADLAGIWHYSLQSYTTLESIEKEEYVWESKEAKNVPFDSFGVAVNTGGEMMRSRVFAVYSYGVEGISMSLQAPGEKKTYEGLTVGAIEGFKMWNILSDPTDSEIDEIGFIKDYSNEATTFVEGFDDIYKEEDIPKGGEAINKVYFVKGLNTFCYQLKMANGYVSPIRQFTVIVSDYVPELNLIVDNYQPSSVAYQGEGGVVNASYIRFLIETAYSLNGSGNVDIDVWTSYAMRVGIEGDNGEYTNIMTEEPTPFLLGDLAVMEIPDGHKLKVGDYVDFTENSYTSDFPRYNYHCTAVFIAKDEYGGVTIVAPQIGDQKRIGNKDGEYDSNGEMLSQVHDLNIDYMGSYFGDPFTVGDSFLDWRMEYYRPIYFGAQFLGFESYLRYNSAEGEIDYALIEKTDADLLYNQFNIVTNDIEWGRHSKGYGRNSTSINFFDGSNFDLIRWEDATVIFSGGDLSNEITLSLLDEDNSIGYMGAHVWTFEDNRSLTLNIANPMADANHSAGSKVTRNFTIKCHNVYGDYFEYSGSIEIEYIDYSVSAKMTNSGAELNFSFYTVEFGTSTRTGKFVNGTENITVTDYFGNEVTLSYEIGEEFDAGTKITYSEHLSTPNPVTVVIERENSQIFVDITDYELMSVKNNGSEAVEVTVLANTEFSYRYIDSNGDEITKILSVDNIEKLNVQAVFDNGEISEDENGTRYYYGEVTVYLNDPKFTLVDKYSGKLPSFTFVPGGESVYTFKAEDIEARLGDKTVTLDKDISVSIDYVLYEIPNPLGNDENDTETPSVQVLAYANRGGYYFESKLALQLKSSRNSNLLRDYAGYKTFKYVGSRANMSELTKEVGWSTAYRFEIETSDTSRVKLFVKEGLYATAPEYKSGKSDAIVGVELNSKLLTVSKNSQFTLFVVDANNNAASIAFDINNLGEAPVPEVVKVTVGSGEVRGYIIPPNDVTDFEIVGTLNVNVDEDENSEYFGMSYVRYSANDDYVIGYSMNYNGVDVSGSIKLSVSEINLREISLAKDGIVWSSNKLSEATAQNVVATVTLTEKIADIKTASEYDDSLLSFYVLDNQIILTYKENHPKVELRAYSDNGSFVTIHLDAVTNIDRSAPVIKEVSRALSDNGKWLILTLSSSERAFFREGNNMGEQTVAADGSTVYLYTRKISTNGTYSYTFASVSGILTTFKVEISELITDELSVEYSVSLDGKSPVDDPSKLSVSIGDKVYINPNRDVTVEMIGLESFEAKSGKWSEIVISESHGGLLPYIQLYDKYGNVLTHQFSTVKVPDSTAPDVMVDKKIYSVKAGTDRAQVEKELLANMVAYDDVVGELKLSVKFTENLDVIGITEVEYIATDSAGNTTVVKEKLRITSIYEPVVYFGEKKISRGEGLIVSADQNIDLKIDCNGVKYMVKLKSGIRTEAQMKDGETVVDYTKEQMLSLGKLEKGIYTLCIITQERDYFKILISVE